MKLWLVYSYRSGNTGAGLLRQRRRSGGRHSRRRGDSVTISTHQRQEADQPVSRVQRTQSTPPRTRLQSETVRTSVLSERVRISSNQRLKRKPPKYCLGYSYTENSSSTRNCTYDCRSTTHKTEGRSPGPYFLFR